jgi:hypothetical protein
MDCRRLEALLADMGSSRRFCHGDQPTLADCCLVPQVFNARRFEVDLSECPRLLEIDAPANALQAFQGGHPSMDTGTTQSIVSQGRGQRSRGGGCDFPFGLNGPWGFWQRSRGA